MTDSRDLISALPDDVLHLLLSFLPADEAVRTCVLAQRWRDLWRSARAVRITQSARAVRTTYRGKVNWTRRSLTNFLNHLLLLRAAGSPMDEIEISCGRLRGDTCYDEHYPCSCYEDRDGPSPRDIAEAEDLSRSAGMWIRHALSICKARALNVSYRYSGRLRLGGVPFVSTQLTKAVFSWASFKSDRLDFSMCPALEDLTLSICQIHVGRILSQSVRRLSITGCTFHWSTRTRISTPRVVSLDISVNTGRAPVIESMPSLEVANVSICGRCCADECEKYYSICKSQRCDGCRGGGNDGSRSVLLEGLSGASDLELTSDPRVFIFREDCKLPTTFTNLKVLVLNDWCLVPTAEALVYFLRHSPLLEKLTVRFEYCKSKDGPDKAKTNTGPKENLLASEQLSVVKLKCRENNKLVAEVSMILNAYGISEEKIKIEPNFCRTNPCGYGESTDSED